MKRLLVILAIAVVATSLNCGSPKKTSTTPTTPPTTDTTTVH